MRQAKALGAKGWIIKPFKPDFLVAAVQKLTAS
jgi:DNA-binding response OmpR family regulator